MPQTATSSSLLVCDLEGSSRLADDLREVASVEGVVHDHHSAIRVTESINLCRDTIDNPP